MGVETVMPAPASHLVTQFPMLAPTPIGPLRANVRNIKNGIVAGLLQRADELGVASDGWFAGFDLDRSQFRPETATYISYRQACAIIERALASLPGDGHGLATGRRQDVGNFGIVGLAMLTAPDFGEALRLGVQFSPVAGSILELRLESVPGSDGDDVAVVASLRTREPHLEPFLCEELFSSCLMLGRGLVGPAFGPLRVELAYPAPPHAADYARVLGCEAAFGMPANRVVIARRWLSTPMAAHNPVSARQVLELCRAQMPVDPSDQTIVAAVGDLLRLQLAESPRLVDVAAELQLAERTLRRHLHGAGTSFQQLRDRVRRDVAEAMLRKPGSRVSAVGEAIGFQDVREFRRAFKRWTGKAPSEARAGREPA